jgi:uncharacterized protein YodC (DUF2158 family)
VFNGAGQHGGPDPDAFDWRPTDPASIAVGDVVYLKTGSPPMTVTDVHADRVGIAWYAEASEELRHATLPAAVLMTAHPKS